MQNYNKIFLPYKPQADINYINLFYFYGIAERYEEKGVKSDILYSSNADIARKINNKFGDKTISSSTIGRMIKNEEQYKYFFSILTTGKTRWIIINNDFSNLSKIELVKNPFVVLNKKVYTFLLEQKDNLLAKYVIYCKYQCGYYHGKTDFTANQFLETFGYSTQSNSTKDKLTMYNHLLEEQGILKIDRYTAENGTRRNTYYFIGEM